MIRILRVLTRMGAGGPPLHVVEVSRALRDKGYRTLLAVGRTGASDGDMEYLFDNDPVRRIEVRRIDDLTPDIAPLADLRAIRSLTRLIREFRPDIVHTHTAKAGLVGRIAAHLASVPAVVHTFHGHVMTGYFSPAMSLAMRRLEGLLANWSDAIVALSDSQAREIAALANIPPSKMRVVPLGLDLRPFAALPDPTGPFTVGWLGRFVPIKNLPLLADIVERMPDVRFLIAGDGPERSTVERLAQRPNVEWLGWQRDVAPVIARSHVLLLTSKNEGTPVALIQGLAARRPFVSTAVGGVTDFRGGRLCAANPDDIVNSLDKLRRSPRLREELGREGELYAAQTFDPSKLTANLDHLYRELLDRRGRNACAG
jgi:glycosyltransferase involved in cell wall biosynthesis